MALKALGNPSTSTRNLVLQAGWVAKMHIPPPASDFIVNLDSARKDCKLCCYVIAL